MKKFVSFEKLSKREQRAINRLGRRDWGPLNPVTRKPEKATVYNRTKARRWREEDSHTAGSFLLHFVDF